MAWHRGCIGDAIPFVFSPLFFLINLLIIPTGFTFFLGQKESHDKLVCRCHICAKAREVFRAIDRASRTMGSKQTKQDAKDSNIENQVRIEYSYSLLDLCNWHSSLIGMLIILILLILRALWCARKHYLCLHKEVQYHRNNHHKLVRETGHKTEMANSDDQPIGRFPLLSRTDTIINSESLQRL